MRIYPEKDGLHGFRELVRVQFSNASYPLEEHIHPDALELCYIAKGSQIYAVNGKRYRVSAGMAYVTYANEPHSTDAMQQEKDVELYYMIIDTLNHSQRFMGLSAEESTVLNDQLNQLNRCFYVGVEFKKRLEEMFRLHREKPPMYALMLRCHACLMINELVCASRRQQPELTGDIYQALMFIEDNLTGSPPGIARMAEHVHLSAAHFKQKFRAQIGLPPMAYQMKRRIELGCDMLRDGASVTHTAFELGFASSQHFSTTFRRYMGVTPREWKKG